jgi:REP element-mobilizing transposase RayT
MAEPPRLPAVLLPWEKRVVYFVTICVRDRREVLANAIVFAAIKSALKVIRSWEVIAGVVMPDHVHLVITSRDDRDLSVGDFSNAFKRLLRKQLREQDWEWQRGCFDRLLRSDESLDEKWAYVRENPVRARLIPHWQEWPYFVGLIDDQRLGKLTASPTEELAPTRSALGR